MKKVKGLENNVFENQTSTMKYSGVKYPIGAVIYPNGTEVKLIHCRNLMDFLLCNLS